jgi:amphi-Trp domain-containing protein
MGEKIVLLDKDETVLRYDAATILRQLGDELAKGKICAESGEVAVGDQIKLKMKGKQKIKDEGGKCSLELELSWVTP